MPALTFPSRMSFETPDAAAPTIAETPALWSLVIEVSYALVSVSPSSSAVRSMVMPASASLISFTARPTPDSMGGPRNASDPVCGSSEPSLRVRSWAGLSLPPEGSSDGELLQPEMTSAEALTSATPAMILALRERVNTVMMLPCVTGRGLWTTVG